MTIVNNAGAKETEKRFYEADLNGDGFMDRVTEECAPKSGCKATQVEMGLSDGSFIKVYREGDAQTVEEGDALYFSPDYFLEAAKAANGKTPLERYKVPLVRYAVPGRVAGVPLEYFGRELGKWELIRLCLERRGQPDMQVEKCIEQAENAPEEHLFQPESVLARNPVPERYRSTPGWKLPADQVRMDYEASLFAAGFDPDLDPKDVWAYSLDAAFVTRDSGLALPFNELYAPFTVNPRDPDEHRLKLRANVIADVKSGRSDAVAEYIYALNSGDITAEEFADLIAGKWDDLNIIDGANNFTNLLKAIEMPHEIKKAVLLDPRFLEKKPLEIATHLHAAKRKGDLDAAKAALCVAVAERIKDTRKPDALFSYPGIVTAVVAAAASYPELNAMFDKGDIIFEGNDVWTTEEYAKKKREENFWSISNRKAADQPANLVTDPYKILRANPDILTAIPGVADILCDLLKGTALMIESPRIAESIATIAQIEGEIEAAAQEDARAGAQADYLVALEGLRNLDASSLAHIVAGNERVRKRLYAGLLKNEPLQLDPALESPEIAVSAIRSQAMKWQFDMRNPNNATRIGEYANLRQKETIRLNMLVEKFAHCYPIQAFDWAADTLIREGFFTRAKNMQGNPMESDQPEIMNAAITLYGDVLKQKQNIRLILERRVRLACENKPRVEGGFGGEALERTYQKVFNGHLQIIEHLVSIADSPEQIPDPSLIIALGERYPQMIPIAMLALVRKGERTPEVQKFVRDNTVVEYAALNGGRRSDGYARIPVRHAIASAYAVLMLGDESEAMRYLSLLITHQDRNVRLAALEAISSEYSETGGEGPMRHFRPRLTPGIELIDTVKLGLRSDDVTTRFVAAARLYDWNAPELALLMADEIRGYRAAPSRMRGIDSRDISRILAKNFGVDSENRLYELPNMETQMVPAGATPEKGRNYPSLLHIALSAVARFGQPVDLVPKLKKIVMNEKRDDTLAFAAQALISLDPAQGVSRTFDRLEARAAPAALFEVAVTGVTALHESGDNIAAFLPRIAHFLHSRDEGVRKLAATTLNALDPQGALTFVIDASRNENPRIRLTMTEALPYFDCERSARRAVEMTGDPDEKVRIAALASLEKYRTEDALKVIATRS